MAFDVAHGNTVLFGGYSSPPLLIFDDTWTWDGTDWRLRTSATHPSPRAVNTIGYDAGRGQIVLFSGQDPSGSIILTDTWVWQPGGVSDPIVNPTNGHSYQLLASSSWTQSEAQAVALGGHLVTINDEAEQDWVYATFSAFGGISRSLWIGLNDIASEGTFVWASGEPVTYTRWSPGEPNGAQGSIDEADYGMIFGPVDSRGGYWNDNVNDPGCTVACYGVVELSSSTEPPPTCVPPPSGMVSWWPGEGNLNDIVGTNHGTSKNGAGFSAGKVGQAFSFDGVDDYVLVPDAADLDITTGITIDAWINPSRVDQIDGAPVLAKGPGTSEAYAFDLASQSLRFYFRDAFSGVDNYHAAQVINWLTADKVGVWTHVAASYDAATGNLAVYVNGVQAATASAPAGTLIRTSDDPVSIASRQGSPGIGYDRNFAGQLDEVEIYNRALSQAEIQAIFLAGSAGKCQGLGCTLSCTASAPSSGTTGIDLPFRAAASTSNCSGTPTPEWDFGDTGHAAAQDATHSYSAAGSYQWVYTATTSDGGACRVSKPIIILPSSLAPTVIEPTQEGDNLDGLIDLARLPAARTFEKVRFRALVAGNGSPQIELQVELRRAEEGFTDAVACNANIGPTWADGFASSGLKPSDQIVETPVRYGLTLGDYQWRVRAKGASGRCSEWRQAYGMTFKVVPLPIVFLPGAMGSEIQRPTGASFCNLWPPTDAFACPGDVTELRRTPQGSDRIGGLRPGGLVAVSSFLINYRPYALLVDQLTGGAWPGDLFQQFAYDWRDAVTVLGPRLTYFIESERTHTRAPRVDVVAHSMGGLVAYEHLSRTGADSHVRRLITAGTPFYGAPEALRYLRQGRSPIATSGGSSFLLDDTEAKQLSHNLPGAYDLLPSKAWFDAGEDRRFLGKPHYAEDQVEREGEGIAKPTDYLETKDFLHNRVERIRPLASEEYADPDRLVLNPARLEASDVFHTRLDEFTMSADREAWGTELYRIAGWGALTTRFLSDRVRYFAATGVLVLPTYYYWHEQDGSGDGTVPLASAAAWSAANQSGNFYVDLRQSAPPVAHAEIFADPHVRCITLGLLLDGRQFNPSACGTGISEEPPTQTEVAEPNRSLGVYSPVEPHLVDVSGRHTGPLPDGSFEVGVPGSEYSPDQGGHVKFLRFVQRDGLHLTLKGTGTGYFDLNLHDSLGTEVQRSLLFRRVPVSPATRAEIVSAGQQGAVTLRIDSNGDGVTDREITPAFVFNGSEPREVPVDIKPGSLANSINLQATVPVAVLSGGGFDTLGIDPLSVRFGMAGAAEIHQRGHWEDVDGDGAVDLVLHFRAAQAGIRPSDTAACLTGTLASGEQFQGCDGIRLVP